jgi:hypothetical protein
MSNISIRFFIHLFIFTYFLNNPKVNFKLNKSNETWTKNIYIQKTKQGNAYHLDHNHSVCAITPTKMRWEEIYEVC